MEGMVRPPSFVGMTWGLPPSMKAMQQFVVPRSIPMIWPNGPSLRSVLAGRRRGSRARGPRGLRDDHLHHRRPEDPACVDIPLADLLDDRVGGEAGPRLRGDGLVEGRIERLAERLDRLHPHLPEALAELPPDERDALPEPRRLGGLGERAVEVVEPGDDLPKDSRGGPEAILLPLALHPLPEVVEIGASPEVQIVQALPVDHRFPEELLDLPGPGVVLRRRGA